MSGTEFAREPSAPLTSAGLSASADPVAPGGLANILAATRMLLGAWDATLNQWSSPAPAGPVRAPAHALEAQARRRTGGAGAQAALSVQLLDGLQIWVGPVQVTDLPRGKARALLVYLLLHRRRPTSRARLCHLFWPEAQAAAARNNLHVILHRVRRQLHGPGLLVHGDEGYQIVTAGEVWIDVEQFEQQAGAGEQADAAGLVAQALAHYEVAAALYRTDLVDDDEREPTLLAHAQALRDRLNQVLERLSCLREARGDLHGCLRTSLRHLGLDACNEAAHRRLMRCYARLGQPQLAERQYRDCSRILALRLGLAPCEETRSLFRQISERRAV